MQHFNYFAVALLLATASMVTLSQAQVNRTDLFPLSIIHINDFHARYVRIGYTTRTCVCTYGYKLYCYFCELLKKESP